jgi:hypothetical protein
VDGARDPVEPGARPSRTAWVLVLALVAVVGLVNVPLPFTGDQALFAVGADALRSGDVLYRDFWDQKQPGIYMFFTLASVIGGASEVSFHLFELAYWIGFAAVAGILLRPHLRTRWIAVLAPALAVCPYLAGARPTDLGQIEILVAFPLVVALLALDDTRGPVTPRRWLVAGLAAGAVLLFKHFYVLIPLIWAARTLWRTRGDTRRLQGLLWMAAGTGLVLLPVAVYFTIHDLWARVWWTYFEYSPRTTSLDPRPVSRLADSVWHLGSTFAVVFVAALAGLVWRGRKPGQRLVGDLVAWIVVGGALVLMQSWWSYHFLLVLAPATLLGVVGLDEMWSRWSGNLRIAGLVVLALLSLPLVVHLADKVRVVAQDDVGLTASGRAAIADELESGYRDARPEVAFLERPDARPGDIYVFGNPLILYLSGRGQAIGVHGWSPEFNDDELWAEIREDLADAAPPYVFVNDFSKEIMVERSPETLAFLEQRYTAIPRATGTWYEAR